MRKDLRQQLRFYRGHPYVKVWRGLNENSIMSTQAHINQHWKTGAEGVSWTNVDNIVTTYLDLLFRSIYKEVKNEKNVLGVVRSVPYFMDKYTLNETEARYIAHRLYSPPM